MCFPTIRYILLCNENGYQGQGKEIFCFKKSSKNMKVLLNSTP